MSKPINNEIIALLSSDLFQQVTASSNVQIIQFNALISLLIKAKIPFDTQYSPGTRRLAAAMSLTIYITPDVTLNFNINLNGGPSAFDNI